MFDKCIFQQKTDVSPYLTPFSPARELWQGHASLWAVFRVEGSVLARFPGFFLIIFFIYGWPELLHFVIVVSIYIMMVNGILHWGWGAVYLLGGFGGAVLVVRFCAWSVIAVGGPCFGPGGCCYWVLWELCVLFGRELGASVPPLPRFILLQSFSDTLLVVSILDVVYDCHW